MTVNQTHGMRNKIEALIFDLDGVITETQHVHKNAWKAMFDDYLASLNVKGLKTNPLSDSDYKIYLDGKPRYAGVKSFLKSRGIELPFGNRKDSPESETICGLGNRKNKIFNEMIDNGGFEIYKHAIDKIKYWRSLGLKTAIVSSSKNCKKIIQRAGIENLFDVRVDGLVSEERQLKGKPDPDIFLEAAQDLGVSPEKGVVFEDAISGVQAGQRGFFGLVVGVNRFDNGKTLLANGADIIIEDFEDFELFDNPAIADFFNLPKQTIFSGKTAVFDLIARKKPIFFLDYDGTLTPIVSRPEDAKISEDMKQTLQNLATQFTVAIITGRDTNDVKNLVQLENLIYAGSHGYSITSPNGLNKEHEKAGEIVPLLDEIEKVLHEELRDQTAGVQIERKRYAIAVHYRNARESDIPIVYQVVEKMLQKYDNMKQGEGKKVVEIKPDLDWHKGKAVLWILEALGLNDREKYLPIFIGDDLTDEDAFKTLQDIGIGILVGVHSQETAAEYSLKNVFQVKEFFKRIMKIYK